jgi:predicted ATPase
MDKFDKKHLERLLDTAKQNGLGKSSLSCGVTTNWVVFTGTYSAGKTTLVQDLAESLPARFRQEPARAFIEEQLKLGRTSAEIWADVESTVMPVHERRVDLESRLNPAERVLLDTAIPDTLPYALLYGTDPEEIIRASGLFRYKDPVFLVEPLPFKSDDIRNSNAQERLALHYLRGKIYINLGYRVVSVPVLDRIGRRDFVLRCLHEMPGKP